MLNFQYKTIRFTKWKSLRSYLFNLKEIVPIHRYCFRGQSNSKWELKPTFERLSKEDYLPFNKEWQLITEKYMVDNYKSAFHLFSDHTTIYPTIKNNLDWLSIMQHHGAATRLLDMSYSPFIATFFALSDVLSQSKAACIWMFPLDIFDTINKKILKINAEDEEIEIFKEYQNLTFELGKGIDIIGYSFLDVPSLRPYSQKGGFLFSLSNEKNFEELLHLYSNENKKNIIKIEFNKKDINEVKLALKDLSYMNISFSTLFPGLDGYTKDLLIRAYLTL